MTPKVSQVSSISLIRCGALIHNIVIVLSSLHKTCGEPETVQHQWDPKFTLVRLRFVLEPFSVCLHCFRCVSGLAPLPPEEWFVLLPPWGE